MEQFKINIEQSIKDIEKDIDNMTAYGMKQIVIGFYSGAENEREFILAARKAAKARGYECVHEYEDSELLLIIRKVD